MVSWALENCQFTVMPALLVQHKPVKSSELDACGLWVDCSLWQTLCSTLIPTPVMVQGEKLWNWELGDWVPLDVLVLISFMTLGKSHCLWALASFWAVFSECFKRSCNFPPLLFNVLEKSVPDARKLLVHMCCVAGRRESQGWLLWVHIFCLSSL